MDLPQHGPEVNEVPGLILHRLRNRGGVAAKFCGGASLGWMLLRGIWFLCTTCDTFTAAVVSTLATKETKPASVGLHGHRMFTSNVHTVWCFIVRVGCICNGCEHRLAFDEMKKSIWRMFLLAMYIGYW